MSYERFCQRSEVEAGDKIEEERRERREEKEKRRGEERRKIK